jgi:hypothetical protein
MAIKEPRNYVSKAYDLIHRIFPNRRNRKSNVLIPSRMGIPSMRVCLAALADNPVCTGQSIAFSPKIETEVNDSWTQAEVSIGGDPKKSEIDPQLKAQTRSEAVGDSVVFKSASQEFKNSILNLDGILSIKFGKALTNGSGVMPDEFDATKVDFDPSKIEISELMKNYAKTCFDLSVFCSESDMERISIIAKNFGITVLRLLHFYA